MRPAFLELMATSNCKTFRCFNNVVPYKELTNTFALNGWNISFKDMTKGGAYKLRPAEADVVNLLRKVAMWILRLPNS